MVLEITEQERKLLLELIEHAEEAAIRSLGHADIRAFKDMLKNRLALLESVLDKVRTYDAQAA
jgi:hypothetical protein